jgi:hypothetical protein
MKRYLFTILAALSLVLCVGVCVMWAWSYRASGRICIAEHGLDDALIVGNYYGIDLGSGKVTFDHEKQCAERDVTGPDPTGPPVWEASVFRWDNPDCFGGTFASWNFVSFGFGFKWKVWDTGGPYGWQIHRSVLCPAWFCVVLTVALPATLAARRLRRKRPPTHCLACGYDLRATPQRCPECGKVVARAYCHPKDASH